MRNAQTVLRNINVSVHDGSALVLTGANGSGKTTFLRMLGGFLRPSAGEILWNGHDIQSSGVFQQYKLQLNWMSLKDGIKEKLTVLENVQWFEVLEGKIGKSEGAIELMGLGRYTFQAFFFFILLLIDPLKCYINLSKSPKRMRKRINNRRNRKYNLEPGSSSIRNRLEASSLAIKRNLVLNL